MFIIIALCGGALPVHAQDENAMRAFIQEKDLKKLDKANAYKTDADNLVTEADRLNRDVLTVQSDPEPDEKVIAKKTKKLESQAQQNQVQASALYEKCNEIKFSLYRQYLNEFWESHPGEEVNYINAKILEEQASDDYFQATGFRIEAKKMDAGYAKIEKLTEANNFESQAIQKQLTALEVYHGIRLPVAEANMPVDSLPVVSNEQVVSNEPAVDSITESEEPQEISDTAAAEPIIPASLIFRIQVASSRVPLTIGQLKRIYPGNYPVEVLTEEGLFKYQFIGVSSYSDALHIVESLPAPRAFIEAYENGTRIGMADSVTKTSKLNDAAATEYHLQIAASKTALSPDELKAIYAGPEPVAVIIEDGWYKYHLKAGNSYELAEQWRNSCGIARSFIVSYRLALKKNSAKQSGK